MDYHVSPAETSQRVTVLLIDDNREQRQYWSDALKHSLFQCVVLEADSGETGLKLYRSHHVDCVVLDFDMPESGFFTLVRLVPDRNRPHVPVVILTHMVQLTLFELMKSYGAYECLVKQHSSVEELANTIRQAMVSAKSKRAM